jgi:hypothetical protein
MGEHGRRLSDFAYADTMDWALRMAIEHLETVRREDSPLGQGVHLKMASMAVRCALLLFKDNRVQNQEVKYDENV